MKMLFPYQCLWKALQGLRYLDSSVTATDLGVVPQGSSE